MSDAQNKSLKSLKSLNVERFERFDINHIARAVSDLRAIYKSLAISSDIAQRFLSDCNEIARGASLPPPPGARAPCAISVSLFGMSMIILINHID